MADLNPVLKRTALSRRASIIWAIASKDILDAVKNKTVLSNILTAVFLVAIFRLMPALLNIDGRPNVLVYDPGNSAIVTALEESEEVDLFVYPSRERMERQLGCGDLAPVTELGFVIPEGFDQAMASDRAPVLEGFVAHWTSEADAEALRSMVEERVSSELGRPLRIEVQERRVYPQPDAGGLPLMTSIVLALTVTWMGVGVVPHLMVEEKETRTLDALRISPAGEGEVVIAKALAGLFYCLSIAVVLLVFYRALVASWGLVVAAILVGALFAVAAGLLLGTLFEMRQQLTLWSFVLANLLLVPLFFSLLIEILPAGLVSVLSWMPAAAVGHLLRVSFSAGVPVNQYLPQLALVAGYTLLLLVAVGWALRRRRA